MRVILPASEIPDGTEVTKPRGSKVYVKKEILRVFRRGGMREIIHARRNHVFLCSDGDANEVLNSTELLADMPDEYCAPKMTESEVRAIVRHELRMLEV